MFSGSAEKNKEVRPRRGQEDTEHRGKKVSTEKNSSGVSKGQRS